MRIEGKVALITGTRRIGGVVAYALAEHGADVALVYNRSAAEATAVARKIQEAGRRAIVLRADLAHAQQVQTTVQAVNQELGGVDILVNVASNYRAVSFEQITTEDWDTDINTNLRSAFLCSQAVATVMRRRGGGRIVNFADWTASSGRPRYKGYLLYYVSKVGIVGLTQALALELAPDILVNAIAPGPIVAPPGLSIAENREVLEATPLGRWGGEQEIAKAVLSLIESEFITGECLRVDGGRHVK